MTISTKGRYALRMMIQIALCSGDSNRYIALRDISQREEISIKYLEQVAALLSKAGFLEGLRGNNGGYRLTRQPDRYTAGDILRAAEGSLAPIACLQHTPVGCSRMEQCTTIDFWIGYERAVNAYVDSITLQDLAEHAKSAGGNDYSI